MTTEEVLDELSNAHPELLKADGFDDAIIGLVEGWFGKSHHSVVCYDYEKCVEILIARDGMEPDEAEEFLQFNTMGAYVGPNTPVFLYRWR